MMKIKKILMMVAFCVVLTACGTDKESDAISQSEQNTEVKAEVEEETEIAKVIKIGAGDDGVLSSDIVNEVFGKAYDKKDLDPSEYYSVEIEDGVTTIGACAFLRRTNMVSVIIPESVKIIDSSAFADCHDLTSIVLPEGLTDIGGRVFADCRSLESIVIPKGMKHIGLDNFAGCNNIVIDRLYMPYDAEAGAFNNVNIKELYFGKDIEFVRPGAYEYANTEKVIFEEGITEIKVSWYLNKKTIKEVELPSSLLKIDGAFRNYTALKNIEIPDGTTTIGQYSFTGCAELETVIIPASVTEIGNYVFTECPKLVLSVTANSAAENYAIENQIPYVITGQEAAGVQNVEEESFTYTEQPADAPESVAISEYLYDKSTGWAVYDVEITQKNQTVVFEIPSRMDELEGDSYIIYVFDDLEFRKIPCQWDLEEVTFNAEKSGVYALVRYDSYVSSDEEFTDDSRLIDTQQ